MRLNNYLLESEERIQSLSPEKAKELLYKNCSQAINKFKKDRIFVYRTDPRRLKIMLQYFDDLPASERKDLIIGVGNFHEAKLLIDYYENRKSLTEILDKLLDPISNNFKKKTPKTLEFEKVGPEIWSEGKAICLSYNYVKEFLDIE